MSNLQDLNGTVKWYDQVRGFGFVSVPSQKEDAFLHRSVLPEQIYLPDGTSVKVDLSRSDKGLKVEKLEVV